MAIAHQRGEGGGGGLRSEGSGDGGGEETEGVKC